MTNPVHADGLGAEFFAEFGGGGLDLGDHSGDALADLGCRQVLPAGQGCQLELVGGHEGPSRDVLDGGAVASCFALGLAVGFVLDGAVVPDAGYRPAVDQRFGTVKALPFADTGDEVFFDGVGDQVSETLDEGLGLGRDRYVTVATAPHGAGPGVHEPVGLAGEIAVDEFHEVGELLGVVGGQDQVVVRSECDRGVNLERILLLSAGQDSGEGAGEAGGGGQEIEAADGAGGDFDAPAWG